MASDLLAMASNLEGLRNGSSRKQIMHSLFWEDYGRPTNQEGVNLGSPILYAQLMQDPPKSIA